MADIDDMQKTNELFKRKLKGLAELSDYSTGKLGIYEDATYISWTYFQGLQRRFYGESIDSLLIFLENVIEDYYIFYNMIIFFIMLDRENNNDDKNRLNESVIEQLMQLQSENEKFIQKLYQGLLALRFQYESTDEKRIRIAGLMQKVYDLSIIYQR
jgi:hypothetical protein